MGVNCLTLTVFFYGSLLAPFMTQISYASTAAELSNKKKYPRFFRTCASDVAQAEALVGLVTLFNWRRVSINLASPLEQLYDVLSGLVQTKNIS